MSQITEQQESHVRGVITQLVAQPVDRIESETIEVKGWCNGSKELFEKMAESATCLANAHGGLLILGVAEEGTGNSRFRPCPYGGIDADVLARKLLDVTHPPLQADVYDVGPMVAEISGVSGAQAFAVYLVKTESINGHITAKGVSKIRVGKECRPNFTAEDDRTKLAVPGLSLGDLSSDSLSWAMAAHQRHYRRVHQSWSSPEEFLSQAGLLIKSSGVEQHISLAALLLFGSQDSYSRYLGHCETILKAGDQVLSFRKNIVDSYRDLCSAKTSLLSSRVPNVSIDVLKELVINAFVHRCYRVASGIVITVSDGALSIQSPGGLAAGLNPNNLVYCVPVYRNLLLAEGARFIGLCDKFGQGLDLVYRAVLSEGFDFPVFEDDGNSLNVTIPTVGDAEFRQFLKIRSQSLGRLEEVVTLRVLYSRAVASVEQLASAMQRGRETAREIVIEMAKKNMLLVNADETVELAPIVRNDIENVFRSNQLVLGLELS